MFIFVIMSLKEKIDKFSGKNVLKEAKLWNDRISFYSEIQTNISVHPYYLEFKKQLHELYKNSYKEDMFIKAYMGKNLPSNELTETIFSNLSDVFESQNPNIDIKLKNEKQSKEAEVSLKSYYKWFKTKGFEHVKTLFNSFLIVDINEEKEPYIYCVAPEYVYYYELEDGKLKEIIFSFDGEKYYYYTDEVYSVYEKKGNEYESITESFHKLKRFPGNIFLYDILNNTSEILRKNIIVPQADDIHKYIIKVIELYMAEFASSNYTKVIPDKPCGYENNGSQCQGGRLFYLDSDLENGGRPKLNNNGEQELCPVCGESRHIGTGAVMTVDFEALAKANINVADIINYFAPPLDGLEYQKTRVEEIKEQIKDSSVGVVKRPTKEARNELDVSSDYESRTKILTRFGYLYGKTIQDTFDVILKILYGTDKVESVNVFLGNKFYLLTKEELLSEKETASDPIQRSTINKEIIKLENKHNPERLRNLIIQYNILPYSGMSDSDFFELIKLNKVSDFDIELRTNINYYINEFLKKFKNGVNNFEVDFVMKQITPLVNSKLNNQNIKNETQS